MLPHVFGEHSKPFYNTVVATFAHQLVTGDTPKIETDGELNLLHAQDVAQIFWDQIEAQSNTKLRPAGRQMLVSELLTRLQSMHERYAGGVVPKLDEAIDTQLFNTLRSMIPHEQRPVDLTLHTDELAFYNRDMELVTERGQFHCWIGGSSDAPLFAEFEVHD